MWQPRIKRTAGTKFLGLVAAIEEDIAAGLIAEGEPMPPPRGVADALGIDLTTVTRAYNEAKTRGLIVARPGRGGTRVAESAETRARRTAESPVDLSLNIPAAAGTGRSRDAHRPGGRRGAARRNGARPPISASHRRRGRSRRGGGLPARRFCGRRRVSAGIGRRRTGRPVRRHFRPVRAGATRCSRPP